MIDVVNRLIRYTPTKSTPVEYHQSLRASSRNTTHSLNEQHEQLTDRQPVNIHLYLLVCRVARSLLLNGGIGNAWVTHNT